MSTAVQGTIGGPSASAPDVDACFSAGSEDLLGLKLGGLFGLLACSTIGVLIPYYCYVESRAKIFFVLRAFAAGVVLTTGYVHVLGDAYPILTDPCLGLSGEYPWAMTFATAATLFTFTLEYFLHKEFHKRLIDKPGVGSKTQKAINTEKALEIDHPVSEDAPPENVAGPRNTKSMEMHIHGTLVQDHELSEEHASRLRILQNTVASYTFEIGIIFHSIFIGVTLGVSSDANTVTALMIALFFHQGNEGLALGCLFAKAGYSTARYMGLALAFILVTPLGVAIGIGVSSGYNGESKAALGTEGVFDSVSAGILIYNGIADLIMPTFAEAPKSIIWQALGFGSMYTGAAIMALIGKWA